MAKVVKINKEAELQDIMLGQDFRGINSMVQVGDKFYVPTKDLLLIVGNKSLATKRVGNEWVEVKDENGNPEYAQSAQRILACRLDGKKPVDVVEIYVAQLAKQDYKGKFVFPENELTKAFRAGANTDARVKDLICNKVLTITDNVGAFVDRKWDNEKQRYARDAQNRLVAGDEKTINEWIVEPLRDVDTEACKEMLWDYYKKNYAEYLIEE